MNRSFGQMSSFRHSWPNIHSLVSQNWQMQLQVGAMVIGFVVMVCSMVACTKSQGHIRMGIVIRYLESKASLHALRSLQRR